MNTAASQWLFIAAGLLIGGWVGSRRQIRSFRETSNIAPSPIWLVLLLVALAGGGYIRFAGVEFGLPLHFHPDEIRKAQVVARMQETGSLNPHYFLHPSLLLYLSLLTNKLLHLAGAGTSYYESAFYSGRLVSAAAGTASIPLVYLIGFLLFGPVPAVIASLLFSAFPLHATVSRYMKEDALLVFFILLVVWNVLRSRRSRGGGAALAAGLFAGFAASTKYTGVLAWAILCALPGAFILPALAAAVIGFFAGTPYALLSTGEFMTGVLFERDHALRGHNESISAFSQWWLYHWRRSILPGVTEPAAALFTIGAGAAIAAKRTGMLFVVLLFLLFYLPAEWVPSKPAPQPERYIAVCLPFLALGAAYAVDALYEARLYSLGLFLAGTALMTAAVKTAVLFSHLAPDTREISAEWISRNVPPGSAVVLDFQPYTPAVDPSRYRILNDPFLPVGSFIDIRKLRTMGADYLVLSSLSYDRFFSQPNQSVAERVKYRMIFSRLQLAASFSDPEGRYGFHNPEIRIYRIP